MALGDAGGRRLFLGVALPDEAIHPLHQCALSLQREGIGAGNWPGPDLYHITVLFLGETQANDAASFGKLVQSTADDTAAFSLTFDHVGAFKRNKVLWIGVRQDEGKQALQGLQSKVVRTVKENMNEPFVARLDDRVYSPHLTLARKLKVETLAAVEQTGDTLGTPERFQPVTCKVTELSLFESTRVQGRLVYPVIERYPFGRTLSQ